MQNKHKWHYIIPILFVCAIVISFYVNNNNEFYTKLSTVAGNVKLQKQSIKEIKLSDKQNLILALDSKNNTHYFLTSGKQIMTNGLINNIIADEPLYWNYLENKGVYSLTIGKIYNNKIVEVKINDVPVNEIIYFEYNGDRMFYSISPLTTPISIICKDINGNVLFENTNSM